MRLRLLINLSCLLFVAGQRAGAQIAPADDFFHSGARFYISNSVPQAKEVVEQGLKLYPDDEKLKKLEQLLNQKQQQQQQQDQKDQQQQQQDQQQKSDQQKKQDQKNSQDQKKPDQPKQDQQKKDQDKKDQPKKDEPPKQPDQPDKDKNKDQDKDKDKDKDQADKPDDKKEDGQPVAPGQMTPEQAKRLLDAQKGNEQMLQLKPPEKPRDPSRPVKDW